MSLVSNSIKGFFRKSHFFGKVAHVPYARIRVIHEGMESAHEIDALIDTGASINLIPMALSKLILGKDPAEIRKGDRIEINCVGGRRDNAYRCIVDLKIRPSSTASNMLVVPNVELYVSESQLPAQFLLGQVGGLERLIFVHINKGPKRYWSLKL